MGMIGDLKIYYTSASDTEEGVEEEDSEEVPTPECDWAWEEYFDNYYLPGWTSHGVVEFKTLEEAKQSCLELPLVQGCAGVTYTNYVSGEWLYSARKGPEPLKSHLTGIKSWKRKWECPSDDNDSSASDIGGESDVGSNNNESKLGGNDLQFGDERN